MTAPLHLPLACPGNCQSKLFYSTICTNVHTYVCMCPQRRQLSRGKAYGTRSYIRTCYIYVRCNIQGHVRTSVIAISCGHAGALGLTQSGALIEGPT